MLHFKTDNPTIHHLHLSNIKPTQRKLIVILTSI